jgi:hypothetical protein
LKTPFTKKVGLVEWLKVKALNSSPSTRKKKKNLEELDLSKNHTKVARLEGLNFRKEV